jgi:hypothetical protein
MSPAAKPADKPARSNRREGPSPVHVLLTSIRAAVAAEVPAAQIVPILDMANSAEGASQAPAFRMCAATLDGYVKAVKPATETQPSA